MLPRSGIVAPYVVRHRRCVVLAPLIFHTFHILIEERAVIADESKRLCRRTKHLARLAPFYAYGIELCHARRGKHRTRRRCLHRRRIIYLLAIGRICFYIFGSRIGGKTHRCAPGGIHDVHIYIAMTVGIKRYSLVVGRPFRPCLIAVGGRQPRRLSASHRHREDIPLVGERYLLAIMGYFHIAKP